MNGKFVCPTAEGSIPKDVLFGIRYPASVLAGGGKGGGRGKGKGRGRGGRFGGRRGNSAINAILEQHPVIDTPSPAVPPPQTVAPAPAPVIQPPAEVHAADDFDVEDLYSMDTYDLSALSTLSVD